MLYKNILAPLIDCRLMPRRETAHHITMSDGTKITTPHLSAGNTSLTYLQSRSLRTVSSDDVVSVKTLTRLVYPVLPPGYAVPDKSDSIGWIKATIRAVMDIVNRASLADHSNALVVSVGFSHIRKGLDLTMTGFWSTLPLFVRQRFLTLLWDLYGLLLAGYDVSMEYYKISMYRYDNSTTPIAYRSVYRSEVEGGLEFTYNRP